MRDPSERPLSALADREERRSALAALTWASSIARPSDRPRSFLYYALMSNARQPPIQRTACGTGARIAKRNLDSNLRQIRREKPLEDSPDKVSAQTKLKVERT